jgi:hypothetical protein
VKIETLRKLANREEIDYLFLLSALKNYSRPREKISRWLKSGDLVRVKKGLYVFGKEATKSPYSLEVLANLIYGPSAISLSYALAFYGAIPERVFTITSITPKRCKKFETPVGNFVYTYVHPNKYPVGIRLESTSTQQQFLMASPEKALCDQIHLIDKHLVFNKIDDMESYLLHDLRIEQEFLQSLHIKNISRIAVTYQDNKLNLLKQFLQAWKK